MTIRPKRIHERAALVALGCACDVWFDCTLCRGHFGCCSSVFSRHARDRRGIYPECRIQDHWQRKTLLP